MSTAVATVRSKRALGAPLIRVRPRPLASSLIIILADALSVIVSIGAAALVDFHKGHAQGTITVYCRLWPLLVCCLLIYAAFGLYPGVTMNAVTELRRTTLATSFTVVGLAALVFPLWHAVVVSPLALVVGWTSLCILIPAARSFARRFTSRRSWWGYPVVVFGASSAATTVVRRLLLHPERGYKPVAVIAEGLEGQVFGVRVVDNVQSVDFASVGVSHAIVAMSDLPDCELVKVMESHASVFPHLLVIPKLEGFPNLGVETRDCCRMLMLAIRNRLLLRGPRVAKKVMDVGLSLLIGVCCLPALVVLAVLIKAGSRGPVFYRHLRIGRHGSQFWAWKFRSMIVDDGLLLRKYLEAHPEEAYEWQCNQKLKDDPRITAIGRFLRKTSFDELPQLWNILKGDMSLVGPRPIVEEEIAKYADQFDTYKQVRPGLTGLWQVSGRNDTTYSERVELDTYYVRNWSLWLDLYLLAKTVEVVVKGQGAY